MPGQAEGSIALALGYGRTAAGAVGGLEEASIASVGVNAYLLRRSQAMYIASGLTVEPFGGTYRLAVTQDHFAIDTVGIKERERRIPILVREGSVEEYLKHPDFAQHIEHVPELESMWSEHPYEGHRWGMSIDLTKCIGCNACVVACQAENNMPVVGKQQVLRGREMHWIRVDRYFHGRRGRARRTSGSPSAGRLSAVRTGPLRAGLPGGRHGAQQAKGSTTWSTTAVSGRATVRNNCPYKVRRFNFFNFHKDLEDANQEISKMVYNPEVTVRSRGVMEKCTYCVQRIQAAKIETKNHGQPIQDGQIVTACQQACPTQAIMFGDLADKTVAGGTGQQDTTIVSPCWPN